MSELELSMTPHQVPAITNEMTGIADRWLDSPDGRRFYNGMLLDFIFHSGEHEVYMEGIVGSGKTTLTGQIIHKALNDPDHPRVAAFMQEHRGDIHYWVLAGSFRELMSRGYITNVWDPEQLQDEHFMAVSTFHQYVIDEGRNTYKDDERSLFFWDQVGLDPRVGKGAVDRAAEELKTDVSQTGRGHQRFAVSVPTGELMDSAYKLRKKANDPGATLPDIKKAYKRKKVVIQESGASQSKETLQRSGGSHTAFGKVRQFLRAYIPQVSGELFTFEPTQFDEDDGYYLAVVHLYAQMLLSHLRNIPDGYGYVAINEYDAKIKKHMLMGLLEELTLPKEVIDRAYERFMADYPDIAVFSQIIP